ncbi:MAG: biotin/lipoyl-containing protein, partial [Candidatus Limnocylindria bacterium]
MSTTIKMPQLGESVTEGTIERWLVKVGDSVAQYDPLFEVVTDKVNAEVPAEVGGVVTSILVGDGETVKVGTPLAEIAEDGEADTTGSEAATDGAATERAESAGAAVAATEVELEAPPAAEEEPPGEAETAQAEPSGVAAPTTAEEPAQPEAAAEAPPAAEPAAEAKPEAASATPEPAEGPAGTVDVPSGDAVTRMTPAVRRLVREHNLDVTQISGSGAGGRVTRDDVLAFVGAQQAAPGAPAAEAPSAPVTPSSVEAVPPPPEPEPVSAPAPAVAP